MQPLILKVIPKPEEGKAVVLTVAPPGTIIMQADNNTPDVVCGKCGAVLLKGVWPNMVSSVVLLCNDCGSYNLKE